VKHMSHSIVSQSSGSWKFSVKNNGNEKLPLKPKPPNAPASSRRK
jgi:hypothetical protein